jgi:hypothetical protein
MPSARRHRTLSWKPTLRWWRGARRAYFALMLMRMGRLNAALELELSSARKQLFRAVGFHQARLSRAERFLMVVSPALALGAFMTGFLVGLDSVNRRTQSNGILVTYGIAFLIAAAGFWILGRLSKYVRILVAIVAAVSIGGYLMRDLDVTVHHVPMSMVFAFGVFTYACTYIVIYGIGRLLLGLERWLLALWYPDSILVNRVSHALWLASVNTPWHIEVKKEIVIDLEDAARMISKFIPRKLRGLDFHSELWIHAQANEIASAIRDLKKWVVSPSTATQANLVSELYCILSNTASGQWQYLRRLSPEKVSASEVRLRIFQIAAAVSRSVVPLILLFAWKNTPFGPSEKQFDGISVATFAVCALYLLVSIDPSAETKIKGVGSILSIFGRTNPERS